MKNYQKIDTLCKEICTKLTSLINEYPNCLAHSFVEHQDFPYVLREMISQYDNGTFKYVEMKTENGNTYYSVSSEKKELTFSYIESSQYNGKMGNVSWFSIADKDFKFNYNASNFHIFYKLYSKSEKMTESVLLEIDKKLEKTLQYFSQLSRLEEDSSYYFVPKEILEDAVKNVFPLLNRSAQLYLTLSSKSEIKDCILKQFLENNKKFIDYKKELEDLFHKELSPLLNDYAQKRYNYRKNHAHYRGSVKETVQEHMRHNQYLEKIEKTIEKTQSIVDKHNLFYSLEEKCNEQNKAVTKKMKL